MATQALLRNLCQAVKKMGAFKPHLTLCCLKAVRSYSERHDEDMFCVGIAKKPDYKKREAADIPWNRITALAGYIMDAEQQKGWVLLHANGRSCVIVLAPARGCIKDAVEQKKGYPMALR